MLLILRQKATPQKIHQISEDLDGYIKIVVDIDKKILAAGGMRHIEGEQKLLEDGSHQKNLWGGGLDLESKEIDYNSIINLRPSQGNPSREVLSKDIRKEFDTIVKKILY